MINQDHVRMKATIFLVIIFHLILKDTHPDKSMYAGCAGIHSFKNHPVYIYAGEVSNNLISRPPST